MKFKYKLMAVMTVLVVSFALLTVAACGHNETEGDIDSGNGSVTDDNEDNTGENEEINSDIEDRPEGGGDLDNTDNVPSDVYVFDYAYAEDAEGNEIDVEIPVVVYEGARAYFSNNKFCIEMLSAVSMYEYTVENDTYVINVDEVNDFIDPDTNNTHVEVNIVIDSDTLSWVQNIYRYDQLEQILYLVFAL